MAAVTPPATSKPTPSAGKPAAPGMGSFDFVGYFKGVRVEWSKITWPSRAQVVAETGVVLVIVTIFSLIVFGIDKFFQLLINWLT